MLNNISNFFNLITGRRVKKTLAPNDMIAVGVRNPITRSDFQPSAIFFKDLEAQITAGVAPSLQSVVNTGNAITNFGGIGTASISSINFTNNRALYLNYNANPTIRIVDNLNAANNLQIDIDTLAVDGVSYNWSSIVDQLPAWLEYNATDRTIWNNGKNNIATNTSYGESALSLNTTGFQNTAIGKNTLNKNTTGLSNTGIGAYALNDNTTGDGNTAIGDSCLSKNLSGSSNTAVGNSTLSNNTSGVNNVAIGLNALRTNTTANSNVAIGVSALQQNITGANNIAVGTSALQNNVTSNNVAVGYQSLQINTTGANNTSIGYRSLTGLTTGSNNTAIGVRADVISPTISGSIMIGFQATSTANNQFVVGSSTTNAGAVVAGVNTSTQYWDVIINGVAQRILLA